ncbi:trypsin-1-like isoform X2 [Physella acuta]|nr:trypsin-1-like isoform X2 [Physella acuta]
MCVRQYGCLLIALSCTLSLVHTQTYTDGDACRRQCQGAYDFYKRFMMSTTFLASYLPICYSKCPASESTLPPSTTTSTTTTTTSTTTTTTPTTTTTTTTPTTTTTTGSVTNSCGLQTYNRYKIVGGTTAAECEFPWVVAVTIDSNFCGGTILDSRHVLTAAHCVKDRYTRAVVQPSQVTVRYGSSNLNKLTRVQVSSITVDPRHIPNINDYDVAVLTLAESLVFSECVSPICLPDVYSDAAKTDYCITAGWGILGFTSPSLSYDLQKVTLPIVDQAKCISSYGTLYVNDLKLCAGDYYNGGIDSCQGDSGGPLMCLSGGRFYVYGIVSFGSGCARPQFPGIYTRVTHPYIRDFIVTSLLN